jgi:hypothetical protein
MKKKIDPIECNVPNINFTLIEKDSKRWNKFKKQRLKSGFDDSELWSLDSTIIDFILPRLKRYLKVAPKTIILEDEFRKNIEAIIKGFEVYKKNSGYPFSIIQLRIQSEHLPNDIKEIKKNKDKYSKLINYNLDKNEFKLYDEWNKVDLAFKKFIEIFPVLWI